MARKMSQVPAARFPERTSASLLQLSWQRAWSGLGASPNDKLRDRIIAAYAEPHRVYHSLQHLTECLEILVRCPLRSHHSATEAAAVEVALWFHDAIYDVQRTDNERRSAAWAQEALLAAGVAPSVAEKVRGLVLATGHSIAPQQPDAQWVVDVDLAILGAPPSCFAEYEAQVRQEYAFVPEGIFRRKRCQVLQAFLAQPTIYSTPYFLHEREAQARENLRRSFNQLQD